jgi:RimJ/RimL family protein N-acetyltransferase
MTPDLTPPDPPLSDGVVRLRPFEDDDVDALYDACQDPEIGRYIPIPSPYDRDDAIAYIARTRREWASGTKAAFAIVDAVEPGRFLGAVNVAIVGAAGNSGYWVANHARGRGVATRALRLLSEWALGPLGLAVVILEIRPENEASKRVARAAGYHEAGRIDRTSSSGQSGGIIFSRLVADPQA